MILQPAVYQSLPKKVIEQIWVDEMRFLLTLLRTAGLGRCRQVLPYRGLYLQIMGSLGPGQPVIILCYPGRVLEAFQDRLCLHFQAL